MLVYFIRHGESESNAGLSNEPDCSLSPHGRAQAARVAERLARLPVEAIYSSPFRRAIETALSLAERLDLPVRLRPEIAEHFDEAFINLRDFRPPTLKTLLERYRRVCEDPLAPWAESSWPAWPESVWQMAARVRRFVRHLKDLWGGSDAIIAVFSHGAPIARALEAWIVDQPGPEFRFSIDNATVNLVRFRGGVSTILAVNESSHLVGLQDTDAF